MIKLGSIIFIIDNIMKKNHDVYKLKASAQNYMQNLVFTNLDDAATVNVSNCVAKVY